MSAQGQQSEEERESKGKPKILAVGAHPDDLEILCSGTLAKFSRLGHRVVMCHVNNGDKGNYELKPSETAKIRRQEALTAARVIRAESLSLEVPDGELFADLNNRVRMIDMIRQVRPDIIITHSPDDYMSDHTATSRLVCDASFLSGSPHIGTNKGLYEKIPPIYFMDTLAGIGFQPTDYVEVTEELEIKKKMLLAHKSQVTFLKEHDNIDLVEFVTTMNRFRGLQCGVRYAEGFRQYLAWPRVQCHRLLP